METEMEMGDRDEMGQDRKGVMDGQRMRVASR